MFDKFQNKRQKISAGDYKEKVKGEDAQTSIDFINRSVQSHIEDKKEAINDHPELADAIRSLSEGGLISSENVLSVNTSEIEPNARVVGQIKKLIDEIVVEENQGTKRFNVP
jgi:hypothetical protein